MSIVLWLLQVKKGVSSPEHPAADGHQVENVLAVEREVELVAVSDTERHDDDDEGMLSLVGPGVSDRECTVVRPCTMKLTLYNAVQRIIYYNPHRNRGSGIYYAIPALC